MKWKCGILKQLLDAISHSGFNNILDLISLIKTEIKLQLSVPLVLYYVVPKTNIVTNFVAEIVVKYFACFSNATQRQSRGSFS